MGEKSYLTILMWKHWEDLIDPNLSPSTIENMCHDENINHEDTKDNTFLVKRGKMILVAICIFNFFFGF